MMISPAGQRQQQARTPQTTGAAARLASSRIGGLSPVLSSSPDGGLSDRKDEHTTMTKKKKPATSSRGSNAEAALLVNELSRVCAQVADTQREELELLSQIRSACGDASARRHAVDPHAAWRNQRVLELEHSSRELAVALCEEHRCRCEAEVRAANAERDLEALRATLTRVVSADSSSPATVQHSPPAALHRQQQSPSATSTGGTGACSITPLRDGARSTRDILTSDSTQRLLREAEHQLLQQNGSCSSFLSLSP